MIVSLIVAMSDNHVIGLDGKLPWHISEDLKRFKALTLHHPVLMGRKTFDSIGKPLPGRTNVVISRNPGLFIKGAAVVLSLEEALKPFRSTNEEVFIIGGGEIFSQSIGLADRVYLTVVHIQIEGDTYFPAIKQDEFKETFREKHSGAKSFTFIDYCRNNSNPSDKN